MRTTSLIILAALVLVISACGGGGGGGGAAASASTTPVTLYYPSGRISAQGFYATGTTTRVGVWSEYFDQAGSPKQWDRSYVSNAWDQAVAWREFNADGSTRNDWTDR